MAEPDFKGWLLAQADRGDWIGHFAHDVRHDEGFPDSTSPEKLHEYLDSAGAMPEAHAALDAAWEGWSARGFGEPPFEAPGLSKEIGS